MGIYQFEDRVPRIGRGTFVAASADIIGDVVIGEQCFIGPGARLRGDYGAIRVGDMTSIQDNCVLHAGPGDTCTVGSHATVTHGVVLHNCTVKDHALVGVGAVVSDYAIVGEWAVIGEGAVIKNNQEIPDGKIAVGVPAKVIGDVTDERKRQLQPFKDLYVDLARRYLKSLRRI